VEDIEVIGGVESDEEKELDTKVESGEDKKEGGGGAAGLRNLLDADASTPEIDSARPE